MQVDNFIPDGTQAAHLSWSREMIKVSTLMLICQLSTSLFSSFKSVEACTFNRVK